MSTAVPTEGVPFWAPDPITGDRAYSTPFSATELVVPGGRTPAVSPTTAWKTELSYISGLFIICSAV